MENSQKSWTDAEDSLLGTATDQKISEHLGRTRGAVKARRFALGIETGRKPPVALVETFVTRLGGKIAARRKAAQLTQAEAAEIAEIDARLWQKYEAGQVEPTASRLARIGKALRVKVDALLPPV